MELLERFEQYWRLQKLPSKQAPVLIAVSGGKDSMVLANLMYRLGFSIALAHCNFQLRGTESDLDEQLVVTWAGQHNVPVHHLAFDTRKVMEENKTGIQETARDIRYRWFKELIKEHQYTAVATAHHANDNAETLLINLGKGTGIAGLHGIPVQNGAIIRPLLFATRKDIDDFAHAAGVPFREDASNAGTQYLRNAVRHKILPVLNEVFPDIVARFRENIVRFTQAEQIYRQAIDQKKKKLIEQRGADFYIPILQLNKEAALETICYELVSDFGFTAAQTPEIIKLLNSESGHYVASSSHKIIRNRLFLIITEQNTCKSDLILVEHLPGKTDTGNGRFIFTLTQNQPILNNPGNIASIDLDTITLPLVLRKRRTGDYFYPLGMGMKKKKLSRFLIDQKIPVHQKEQLWILENNKQIVWISGLRIDERFKVKPSTKKVLNITFLRN